MNLTSMTTTTTTTMTTALALSSFVLTSAPLVDPLRDVGRVLEYGAMIPLFDAQSALLIASARRCSLTTLGRVGLLSAQRASQWERALPPLLRPRFIVWMLYLGITTFFSELWHNLYIAQYHYEVLEDLVVGYSWTGAKQWLAEVGSKSWFIRYVLVPWEVCGWLASGMLAMGIPVPGWSPSPRMMVW